MKKIQPIQIWVNGQIQTASWLSSQSIQDNLATFAKFQYALYADGADDQTNGDQLADGNLTMDGQDYIDWNANPDINEDAYIWIANKLGLTLI